MAQEKGRQGAGGGEPEREKEEKKRKIGFQWAPFDVARTPSSRRMPSLPLFWARVFPHLLLKLIFPYYASPTFSKSSFIVRRYVQPVDRTPLTSAEFTALLQDASTFYIKIAFTAVPTTLPLSPLLVRPPTRIAPINGRERNGNWPCNNRSPRFLRTWRRKAFRKARAR